MNDHSQSLVHEACRTLRLAVPMILGQLGGMAMGWVDVAMVGRGLGSEALAGLAFGVNAALLTLIGGYGLISAVSVLVARAYGARDARQCRIVLRGGLLVSSLFSLLAASVITVALGMGAMKYAGQEDAVVATAQPYLLIFSWGFVFALGFANFRAFCEARDQPWLPFGVLCCAIALNVFLNWVLIFGNLGMPRLEVTGAAIATVCSHAFSLVVLGGIVLVSSREELGNERWHVLQLYKATMADVGAILRLGIPTSLQIFLEVGAFVMAAVMMGWIGAIPLAAHQVAMSLAAMSFMVPLGFSFAVSIRVGQAAGAQLVGSIHRIGRSSFGFVLAFMSCTATAFILGRDLFPTLFSNDPRVIFYASKLLIVVGIFQLFDGLQVTVLGALRGLQDVRGPLVITLLGYWLVCVPLSYVLGFIFEMGGVGIWAALAVGLCIAATVLTIRWQITSKRLLNARAFG